jgi:hypothetical protein
MVSNQPIFTATPIFEGMVDPLPRRMGYVSGYPTVPLRLPPADWRKHLQRAATRQAQATVLGADRGLGYQRFLESIGDDKDGFHAPIRNAVASFVRLNPLGDTDALKAEIRAAASAAIGRIAARACSP